MFIIVTPFRGAHKRKAVHISKARRHHNYWPALCDFPHHFDLVHVCISGFCENRKNQKTLSETVITLHDVCFRAVNDDQIIIISVNKRVNANKLFCT